MSINPTDIEWTDFTTNPLRAKLADGSNRVDGHYCEKISPECANCYTDRWQPRYLMPTFGVSKSEPVNLADGTVGITNAAGDELVCYLDAGRIRELLRSKKIAGKRVFICDMTDMFGRWVKDEWLACLFALFWERQDVTWQVLTKRTIRMSLMLTRPGFWRLVRAWRKGNMIKPAIDQSLSSEVLTLDNVWAGTSIGDQKRADERREPLQKLAAAGWLTWVSYEPAIGPVKWEPFDFIRWMVSGGETGADAPSHPDWHRAARDFCRAKGIAYFFKQWGDWRPKLAAIAGEPEPLTKGDNWGVLNCSGKYYAQTSPWNGRQDKDSDDDAEVGMVRTGKKAAGRTLDGRTWDEMPAREAVGL